MVQKNSKSHLKVDFMGDASTQELTKVTRLPTAESIQNERYSNDNDYHYNFDDDDDQFIPIPSDMFEMDPPTSPLAQIPSITSLVPNKLQPTQPIPTSMTNKYAVFTSNDDEDNINENDEGIKQTGNVKRAPETGITQIMTTQMMTSTKENDADMDNAGKTTVTKQTNLQKTDTMNKLHTTALDLGSLVKSNKNLPEYNVYNDEASQVTVATKNSTKGNPYTPKT